MPYSKPPRFLEVTIWHLNQIFDFLSIFYRIFISFFGPHGYNVPANIFGLTIPCTRVRNHTIPMANGYQLSDKVIKNVMMARNWLNCEIFNNKKLLEAPLFHSWVTGYKKYCFSFALTPCTCTLLLVRRPRLDFRGFKAVKNVKICLSS
jgi:hypothetical protein